MNSNRFKNIIYSVVLLSAMGIVHLYRNYNAPEKGIHISGITMGTVRYNVKYFDKEERVFDTQIAELLDSLNQSLSVYIPTSEISVFNKSDAVFFKSRFFLPVLKSSKEIHKITDGAFDPTIMPLVRGWGFAANKKPTLNESSSLDSLLNFVGFNYISFDKKQLKKSKIGVELDFGAIAKGYAVDLVADLLRENNIQNFFVEIGGEVICSGKKASEKDWLVGINDPTTSNKTASTIFKKIALKNKAMATSGNYRNFYIRDGKKYAHTISPTTGKPVQHSLLSASVFAPDCMTADALATAFMVMGKEKAVQILENHKEFDAFLIYHNSKGELETYQTNNITIVE